MQKEKKEEQEEAKNYNILIAVSAFVVLNAAILYYFFPYAIIPVFSIYLFTGLIVLTAKFFYGKNSIKELLKRKRILIKELEIAEKQLLKRKLSKKAFDGLVEKKQMELIKIDAKLARLLRKKIISTEEEQNKLGLVPKNKKHILKKLLKEKEDILKERKIIESKYHNRKINEKVFSNLITKNSEAGIENRAAIQQLIVEQEINQTMNSLKTKLSGINSNKTSKHEIDLMAENIVEEARLKKNKTKKKSEWFFH